MPPRRKPARTRTRPGRDLALPLIGLGLAVAIGLTAFLSGLYSAPLPFLIIAPIDGLLLLALPILVGMLLLRAASDELPWRTAGLGAALAAAALGVVACLVVLFGAGFHRYVGQRATAQELQRAASDLIARHQKEDRVVLSRREVRADPATEELIRRLQLQSVTVDQGGRKIKPTVFFGWGTGLYGWGIEATPTALKYHYGTHQ